MMLPNFGEHQNGKLFLLSLEKQKTFFILLITILVELCIAFNDIYICSKYNVYILLVKIIVAEFLANKG